MVGSVSVNRRYELNPPQPIISMFYRADRRRDPTPNDTNSHRLQGSGACEVGKHLDLRGLPGGGGSPPKPVSYCRFPVYQGIYSYCGFLLAQSGSKSFKTLAKP
jgi:hypothetical protein